MRSIASIFEPVPLVGWISQISGTSIRVARMELLSQTARFSNHVLALSSWNIFDTIAVQD